MFISHGVVFFFAPPYCLIWLVPLLCVAFTAVYAGQRIFRVTAADIAHPKGSLWPLSLRLCIRSAAAMIGALIGTQVVSYNVPWVGGVHSEWGIDMAQDWGKYAVYAGVWALLFFALLLMFTYRLFKRHITDTAKARRMCLFHAAAAALVWALLESIPLWWPDVGPDILTW